MKFYITSTLPYVNAEPHIGFAMELIRTDIIARYKKMLGYEVFLNTGTDEHGQKIFDAAKAKGIEPKELVDGLADRYEELKKALNICDAVHSIRTSDKRHVTAAQEFWKRCDKAGYIYKKHYASKYCVGCELNKTDSELENGKCPIHPNLDIQIIEEENYFFKFSEFQKPLLDLYKARPDFVVPDFRFNEIKAFVERGLDDFSISRLRSKMPWGVPVPSDDDHVMYVWFDALTSYISTLGWPSDEKSFDEWWVKTGGVVQYCGKDNLRQQAAIWQAMLIAAGLPNSKQIVINGFITGEGGLKMSKSLGNVVSPFDVIKEYNTETLRYYVARELHPFEDSPFSAELLKNAYNSALANGIGNLLSRVMKMAETNGVTIDPAIDGTVEDLIQATKKCIIDPECDHEYVRAMEKYDIKSACDIIWQKIALADKRIQSEQPFKLVKTDPARGKMIISDLMKELLTVSVWLEPILPVTSAAIQECLKSGSVPKAVLFGRKD
ncbi:MAG: methionine--tRNA ligase [Patescibacteria group bacterium]